MTARFVITAVGDDRPGIVAGFTAALLPLDGNLEDTAMTLLEGQFAMVIVVSVPTGDAASLQRALDDVADSFGLTVQVRPLALVSAPAPGRDCSLTVYGADHPGIVHRVAAVLAAREVNIIDLATRVIGRDGPSPVYAMLLELRVPATIDDDTLAADLAAVGQELGVECTFRAVDADIF